MKPYYQDDAVTIYLGDCRELFHAWDLAGAVMVTDPPYGMSYKSGWSGRSISNDDTVDVRDAVLAMWAPRPALVFGRWDCPRPAGVKQLLVWDKGDWPGMGDLALPWGPSTEEVYVLGSGWVRTKRAGTVLRVDRLTGDTVHPNEKPVSLLSRLLAWCPPMAEIVDPFMGSGTTLRAAKDLGRKAIGVELDERYCEIAANRCAQEVLPL